MSMQPAPDNTFKTELITTNNFLFIASESPLIVTFDSIFL